MSHFGKYIFRKKCFLYKCGNSFSNCQSFMSSRKTSDEYKTMNDIKINLVKKLKIGEVRDLERSKGKYIMKSQSELPVRKMKNSFDTAIVPLSSNIALRDRYITFLGNVRVGRLMEDVDLFAVWCCFKHLNGFEGNDVSLIPYAILTIRVDHIEMTQSLYQPDADIRVSGHVCWVGTSSLEVIIWLDQFQDGKWERIMKALLLMACRNLLTMGAFIVNKIEAETPEEKLLLKGGEERKHSRLKLMNESPLKKLPSEEELHLIHDLFIKSIDSKSFLHKRHLPPKSTWMRDASMKSWVFCHPQYKNLHNKIFGGFLIRQALELSWNVGYFIGKRLPKLIHISDIGFYNPVDVGSMLKLNASITYAEDEFIQVFVDAEAFSKGTSGGKSTTSFNFTYSLDTPFETLYPYTYLEAMKYVEGRRHFQAFKKLSNQGKIS